MEEKHGQRAKMQLVYKVKQTDYFNLCRFQITLNSKQMQWHVFYLQGIRKSITKFIVLNWSEEFFLLFPIPHIRASSTNEHLQVSRGGPRVGQGPITQLNRCNWTSLRGAAFLLWQINGLIFHGSLRGHSSRAIKYVFLVDREDSLETTWRQRNNQLMQFLNIMYWKASSWSLITPETVVFVISQWFPLRFTRANRLAFEAQLREYILALSGAARIRRLVSSQLMSSKLYLCFMLTRGKK